MIRKQAACLSSAICLVFLGWLPAWGAESATSAGPSSESPTDLAILLDQHMLVVRLRVKYANAPFVAMWQNFVESKFDAADKDHNGLLDAEEFLAVKPLVPSTASNANNRNMAQVNGRRRGGNNPQPIVDPDEADTGRELMPEITRHEFVEFLRGTPNGPVRTDVSFIPSAASRALFTRLDTDHDDKLSTSECEHAFDTLHPLDLVGADLFTPNQLRTGNAGLNPNFYDPGEEQRATPVRLVVKVLRFSNPAPLLAWADRIRQHFSPLGAKASDLRRTVMLYDEATLAAIDADGDGLLDQSEVAHLQSRPIPNLELIADQGREEFVFPTLPVALRAPVRGFVQPPQRREGTVASTSVCLDRGFRFDPAVSGQQGLSQPARLSMGGEQIEISSGGFVAASAERRGAQVANNLKQFDQDKNDYLEEKELRRFGNNNNFMALDSNGDGKLYFSEIEEYVDAQAAAAAVRLVVEIADHDHAMFESLDTDRDGRLARRELAQLVSQAAAWDRDGDGQLAFDEVPRLYTVRVAQDQPQLPFNRFFGFNNFAANESRRTRSKSGPAWFTEMDRNSDGDISRKEFLGTAAQFRQFDTDGDQLIDVEEATRTAASIPKSAVPQAAAPPAGDTKTVPAGPPPADAVQ